MDTNTKYGERQELIDIYNNLSFPLKKRLLTLVRVIDATRKIVAQEGGEENHSNIQ